jgi:hypothetical protein
MEYREDLEYFWVDGPAYEEELRHGVTSQAYTRIIFLSHILRLSGT